VIGANAIYFAVAASGLVAAHALSAQAFTAIKWAGAGYLLWLGSRMILRTFAAVEARAPVADAAHGRAFWRGFVAQGANPNLLVYFGAILPQFVDARAELAPQVALLALSSFVIEFTILSLYAGLSARAGHRAAPGLRLWLERAGGGLLVGAAAGLARLEPE
jgi:homoserine/homoserine lactone efflux protein